MAKQRVSLSTMRHFNNFFWAVSSAVLFFASLSRAQDPVTFGPPTEDRRFCELYAQIANPLFVVGLVITIVVIIGAGIYIAVSKENAQALASGRRMLKYTIGAFIVLLIVTRLPQSVYNLITAGTFQSSCF